VDVRIAILGPLEVRDAAGNLVPVGGARLRSLLIRLAIDEGRPVSVDRLADDLWADGAPADAANAVQALVSRLRGAAGRDCVEYGPAGYRLAVDPAQVDARAFEQAVIGARGMLTARDQAAAAAALREALGLWRGPALADVADSPFAAAAITRLSELRLAAIEDRVEADLALGRGAELVPELGQLTDEHPLRERMRGQLMRALQAAGRQADALAAYEDTRRELADQLGVDPSPGLAAVHLAILRGEPQPTAPQPTAPGRAAAGGPTEPPAQPSRPPRHSNLPAQLTSFVGRDDELRRLGKLLGESRLVTLTGPGGAGKTRLSIEASAAMSDDMPDGVWFVPLAPVRDTLDVPQAVLTAIGLQEASWPADPAEAARLAALQPLDRLADALASRRLLLVLDNCEHLVEAVAWLTGRVLAQAPGVRILATSREPLGITGETLCPVPSLQLPAPDAGAADAALSPAIRLFADRAVAVRPGFAVDTDSADPVVRICRALDGIPLAIELAAARLRVLTPAQVADRLDDRFRLLSVGSRGVLPRHQTLRAIVDWSWDLLDDTERAVLRRLSVFSGGATPDSAEHVCALGGDRDAIIDIIASLVDKSLVTATGEREVRYRLLETVRAYAADRLAEAGETDQVRAAHVEFFLGLAERSEPQLRSRDQLRALDRLSAEHDNCTAALRSTIAARDAPRALRFISALVWFWIMRDYEAEATEWVAGVREITGGTAPPGHEDAYAICELVGAVMQAQDTSRLRDLAQRIGELVSGSQHPLLLLAGPMSAILSGDLEGAQRGLAALADHPDPWLRAAECMFAGLLAIGSGQIGEAADHLATSYEQFVEIGDRWSLLLCLNGRAEIALDQGEPATAIRLLEEARGYAAEGMHSNFGEMMSIPLGRARARMGDIAGARAELERGISAADRIGQHDDEATGYVELSELARSDGDLALARSLLDRACQVVESKTRQPGVNGAAATAYSKIGCVAEQSGDLAEAARWHAKALALLTDNEPVMLLSNPALATVVEGIAALAAARGEHARSAELLGLADALQGFTNAASQERHRADAANRAALAEADVERAYARGRGLGQADALALTP
jgi:predicted ATPase/DNA-binding SARP family transcriptional activator